MNDFIKTIRRTSLKNKVVLVTGASSGIGEALSLALAREGCRVGLLARREKLLSALEQQIKDQGGEALAMPADVMNQEQIRIAVNKALVYWGGIDIAVANAGLGRLHRVVNLTTEKVHKIMDLNFYGAWHLFEAVLPCMLRQGKGHLVGISSIASFRGLPKSAPYSASKAALTKFMESARGELRSKGIHCTVIHPGFVQTPLSSQNRMKMPFILKADEAADIIIKYIRQRRSEVVIPWQLALMMPIYRNLSNRLFDRLAARGL